MATVVRVKRRCDDEPIEAFILNCKRRKISEVENTDSFSTTVFRFAETSEKDEDIASHFDIKYAEKTQKLKNSLKKHSVDINEKLRAEHIEISKSNRYKIVNSFRSQTEKGPDSDKAGLDKSVTFLDLEDDLEEKHDDKPNPDKETTAKYVYDLYYNHSCEFETGEIEDCISVHPVNSFTMESVANNDDLDSDNESEDSNAENNWRNDYPDESDVESINENDMQQAMKNIHLDDDLLSSDDEENGLFSGVDDDDVIPDKSDIILYGRRYAMFKAKSKKMLDSDLDDSSE